MELKIKDNKTYLLLIAVSIIVLMVSTNSSAQNWNARLGHGIWDNWSVNINAGISSYFGDLSYYDHDVNNKFKKESSIAYGFILSKHLSKKFNISGQLLIGGLKGGNEKNISFRTSFVDYNIQGRVNIINLLRPEKNNNLGFSLLAGIGHMLFNVTEYTYNDGTPITQTHNTRVPEFIYIGGGSIDYKVSKNIRVNAELTLRQPQNDKPDNLVKNDDFDYYTYMSFGFTYFFNSANDFGGKSISRLAHNGIRMK